MGLIPLLMGVLLQPDAKKRQPSIKSRAENAYGLVWMVRVQKVEFPHFERAQRCWRLTRACSRKLSEPEKVIADLDPDLGYLGLNLHMGFDNFLIRIHKLLCTIDLFDPNESTGLLLNPKGYISNMFDFACIFSAC